MDYSYEDFLEQLGGRLRQMRKERGWSLHDMITEHGFHLSQWQALEKGTGTSVPTLLRLCAAFDLTLEELVAELGRVEAQTTEASALADRVAKPDKRVRQPKKP